jgi:hypothetical protein
LAAAARKYLEAPSLLGMEFAIRLKINKTLAEVQPIVM